MNKTIYDEVVYSNLSLLYQHLKEKVFTTSEFTVSSKEQNYKNFSKYKITVSNFRNKISFIFTMELD